MAEIFTILTTYRPNSAVRTFPSSVSVLKSFASGCFLKVVLDMVSFLLSDIFSSETQRKKMNKVPHKYYIIDLKNICLSPSITTFTLYT